MEKDQVNISTAEKDGENKSSSLGSVSEYFKKEIDTTGYTLLSKRIQEGLIKHQTKINQDNKKFHEESLEKIKKDYKDDIEVKTRNLEDKIENSKISIIETLGMFVALFTFISVDFQVFRSYRDPMAIGALTSILVGSIFLFIVVFDYFILQARKIRKTEENLDSKKYIEDGRVSLVRKIIFCISLILIFLGIFTFSKTTTDEINDNYNQIKKEVLNSVNEDIVSQKNELKVTNDSNQAVIKKMEDRSENIKKCIKNFGLSYRCFE